MGPHEFQPPWHVVLFDGSHDNIAKAVTGWSLHLDFLAHNFTLAHPVANV
jgi:hypothetical protein